MEERQKVLEAVKQVSVVDQGNDSKAQAGVRLGDLVRGEV